jgi:para-nitrobenzyl esterase
VSGPRAETASGLVEGFRREGVMQFLGVPYAVALGAGRFLDPVPVAPWAGVRRADVSRTSPPQLPQPELLDTGEQAPNDEDCLQVDIYTPAADDGRRPVMVWFYGGGFTSGSAGTYNATMLAARGDVVVVTVNYRLGVLGFSYLEHLDKRFTGSANAGLRDQIESLRWVRDNIASFGGDPGCVTIFGESAGGHSVGCLLTSPEAEGLFHRGILQSSAGWGLRTLEWAEGVTAQLMAQVGATTVEELQAADVDAVLAAQAAIPMRAPGSDPTENGPRTSGTGSFAFSPTLDGVVLRGHVIDEIAAGRAAAVPLLVCHTRDETKLFSGMGLLPDLGDEQGLAGIMAMSHPDGYAALEAYRKAEPAGSPNDWFISFLSDQNFHMPDFRLADLRIRHDPRVWMARFSWETDAVDGKFGACHGMEIPFLFYRPGKTGGFLEGYEPPLELVHAVQDAWTMFARTGDPNCASLPAWPRYEAGDRAVMSLDDESRILHDPDGAVRTIWEDVAF